MNRFPASSIPRRLSEAFRQEALHQLTLGRSLQQVSTLLNVSTQTLARWRKKEASLRKESSVEVSDPANDPPHGRLQRF